MQSAVLKTCARAALTGRAAGRVRSAAAFTTYSGGQPSEGQGGFYGSAKTRSEAGSTFSPGSRAEPQDVSKLTQVMQEWEAQKASLAAGEEQKKALAQLANEQGTLIQRLVVKGAPVWGLSTPQREFVAECSKASV
ncbi:hypothetical protein BBJ28_00015158 [Nothophytophthora sp. Chile5]|nr:hypothetical protein BBJ28_00015158 [Nothophytophthora sp. Chile5]